MSALELFRSEEFELSITQHEIDGFRVHAAGVAKALGFRDHRDLTANIPDAEKGTELVRGSDNLDRMVPYLTEAGFNRALGQRQTARIKDPEIRELVERFQTWVYGTVLPGMRRGVLVPAQRDIATISRRELAMMIVESEDAREAAEAKVAEMAPKVEIANAFITARGDYSVREAAQMLKDDGLDIGQDRLFERLYQLKWLDPTGRPYQRHVDCGRLRSKPQTYGHPRTGERIAAKPQVRVTPKGVADLYRLLAPGAGLALLTGPTED